MADDFNKELEAKSKRNSGFMAIKTKVVHCKCEPYDVMIDRTTQFGNPFHIGPEYGNREEVIAAFKDWFYIRIDIDSDFEKAIQSLKGKVLGCWYAPKACHGDIIVEYLENQDE